MDIIGTVVLKLGRKGGKAGKKKGKTIFQEIIPKHMNCNETIQAINNVEKQHSENGGVFPEQNGGVFTEHHLCAGTCDLASAGDCLLGWSISSGSIKSPTRLGSGSEPPADSRLHPSPGVLMEEWKGLAEVNGEGIVVIRIKIAEIWRGKVQDKRQSFRVEGKSLLMVLGNCIWTISPRGLWKEGRVLTPLPGAPVS